MRKTYQSLKYVDDSYCILVNGNKMFVRFDGGSLQPRVNGKFTTTDPDVMAAMESCKGFNKEFRLVSAEDTTVKPLMAGWGDNGVVLDLNNIEKHTFQPTPAPDPDPDPEDTGANGPDYGEGGSGNVEIEEVPGITTVQAAKEYLINKKEVQVSKLPNKAAVLEHAAMNNVKFVDLQ